MTGSTLKPDDELPTELEDRIENATTVRGLIAAIWDAFDYTLTKTTKEDYEVERHRKLEIDRNSSAAVAGIAFLCLLTIITLNTQSPYLSVSFYTLSAVTPLLVARALVMEHYLRANKPPRVSMGWTIMSLAEWLGLAIGIVALVAHYSVAAAVVMGLAGGVAGWFLVASATDQAIPKPSQK